MVARAVLRESVLSESAHGGTTAEASRCRPVSRVPTTDAARRKDLLSALLLRFGACGEATTSGHGGRATVGVLGLTEVFQSSGLRLMTERFPTSPMPGAAAAVTRLPARQPLFGGGQGEFLIANF